MLLRQLANPGANRGELNSHTDVVFVHRDLFFISAAANIADEKFAQLMDLVPGKLSTLDRIKQVRLAGIFCLLPGIDYDDIRAL